MNVKNLFSNKKNLILVILIISAIAACLLVSLVIYKSQSSVNKQEKIFLSNEAMDNPIGEIVEGMTVCQTIPVEDNITKIELLFATYIRENTGFVFIDVVGADSGKVYYSGQLDVSDLLDNSYVSLPLSTVAKGRVDSQLQIKISGNGAPGNAVTVWASEQDVFPEGECLINEEPLTGDLSLKAYGEI